MEVIKAKYEFLRFDDNVLNIIEQAARTCYKSEDKITEGSAERLIKNLVNNEHYAMLEHSSFTVKFTIDRGVSHEIVRHRQCSFAQESTRYVNYNKKGCVFIKPLFWEENTTEYKRWYSAMEYAEETYNQLIKYGCTPQEARSVLPNSTKTELVVTANIREWLHILKLRTAKDVHPQTREVMIPLLFELKKRIPVIFDSIEVTEEMYDFVNKYNLIN